ncbi:MAG: Cobalamin B12-binding domain protein [Parcubacteria group bacterium GW2011_GWE2_38_18]|nr:MAG: Cobalamin B12-binding domain protein [Parcubacteria group bacterium GW2011_GWE2_38_18]
MNKKVALIQPQINIGKSLGIAKAPESIMALAGQLEKLGYQVRMFHASASPELMESLEKFSPDYVGISTMTPNYPEGRKIAETLKKYNPELPIILGGWHASGCVQAHLLGQESESLAELLNKKSPFDFVIAGEGEKALPELLCHLEYDVPVEAKNGVSFFRRGKMHVSPLAERIQHLVDIATPSWKGLNVDDYRDKRSNELDLSVHFNRACRFKCSFCATAVVYGQGVKTTPALQAVAYIRFLVETFHPQVITFTDEDFFANQRWVNEIVDHLEQAHLHEKYGVVFDTFASINDLHYLRRTGRGDLLDHMKEVGFRSFTIGIESFNPAILLKFNKEQMIIPTMGDETRRLYPKSDLDEKKSALLRTHLLRAQQAIEFAQEHDIMVVGDYILGNLGETEAEVREGFELFKNIKGLLTAYIPVFTPFPGTAIWAEAYDSGLLARTAKGGIDWEQFNASAGALNLGYDIETLRNQLELEFYTSSRYTEDMLNAIENNPDAKKLFIGRFNYLDRVFPKDERIQRQLALLDC